MPRFNFEIYTNIQHYGSIASEADSFHEAAQKFAGMSDLSEAEWDEQASDYESGAAVDRISCWNYKLSPDAGELEDEDEEGEEVSVNLDWRRAASGDFELTDVLDSVRLADASVLNQQLEQDTAAPKSKSKVKSKAKAKSKVKSKVKRPGRL